MADSQSTIRASSVWISAKETIAAGKIRLADENGETYNAFEIRYELLDAVRNDIYEYITG